MACGSQHPDLPIRCQAPDAYPNHDHHFAMYQGTPVEWVNEDYVAPPPEPMSKREATDLLKGFADQVPPPERSRPVQGIDPGQVGGAPVGHNHPTTSAEAAGRVKVGSQQAALLAILAEVGEHGSTCAAAKPLLSDIMERDISRNQTATRMGELGERGLAERTWLGADEDGRPIYEERPTDTTGNTGAVWRITEAGLAEARRLDLILA